ncbi:Glu-tRNA(Gln) amidotransferase subunit GatD [Candidatus Woesearchaeota archaeon]|nr:Glu-tRNA(Gln) amidotransferase subunit GatD [Candidatus Woesearchaeota archaeon]
MLSKTFYIASIFFPAMAEAGDKVRITTKEKEIYGILMPNESSSSIFIKLDSGYNIGISKKKIREIKVVEPKREKKEKKKTVKEKKGLKKIAILHTGGTIASKVDYRTGGVFSDFTPEELLAMFPELKNIANIDSVFISNMWSDDIRFGNFGVIANAIQKEAKNGADGIIVGMGTDNLAVAAAALSFIVEKTPVPIIFVGAQRSSDRGSSDAGMNLICAARFIACSEFRGVAICMHHKSDDEICAILPATKTKKLHSSRRDAFKPVNAGPIALIDYKNNKINMEEEADSREKELLIKPKMEEKVGILKIHVNMFPEQIRFYRGYNGLVLEGTGLGQTPGHVPNEEAKDNEGIFQAIKELIDSGCVILMTTGCLFGRVNMNIYDKGRDLLKLGVIPGEDMLPETAFVKLAWLLGNYPKDKVKELLKENLRGEISDRSLYKEDFLE